MENIRDIRKKKNLFFVLPKEILINNIQINRNKTAAVIIFLYYKESLYDYFSYIEKIPLSIDVYIVSNNDRLNLDISQFLEKNMRKIVIIKSENRGRDVSALLVACHDITLQYEYICFVHDKKRKSYISKEDFDLWIENLWGNTLGSKKYILNVLQIFEKNKEVGLLVPPEPIGKTLSTWYDNGWGGNFELTRQLSEELRLKCDLNPDKSPITFGTVFWAKSICLKKIFDKKWKYEDFDEEPLKDDGTTSHAIERILGYVAQDAGYDTGTIMNTLYAEKVFSVVQENFKAIYQFLKRTNNIYNFDAFLKKINSLYEFCKKNTQVYLYGAGKLGKECLQLLREEGFEPTGYVVTDTSDCDQKVDGLSVSSINEINYIEEVGIIITAGGRFQEEIEENLRARNIKNYIKYKENF